MRSRKRFAALRESAGNGIVGIVSYNRNIRPLCHRRLCSKQLLLRFYGVSGRLNHHDCDVYFSGHFHYFTGVIPLSLSPRSP
jgi:hypothetical protein